MDNIKIFLKKYSLLKQVDKNFFQITRFPHYENVSSNVLKFYFEKCALVLEAFLNCISVEYSHSIDPVEKVEREEGTMNNNRIDIVVYTNNYIIGIENKINAGFNNPIDNYYEYLDNKAKKEDKELLLIVLSKNKITLDTKCKNILHNVLYKDCSAELKKYYPELLNCLGYRYFFLLTEYIANIDFLEGDYFMNKEFVEIAKQDDNSEKIVQIMSEGNRLRGYLNKTAYEIKDALMEYSKSFGEQSVELEPDQIWATTIFFQNCYLPDTKYSVTIEVIVNADGFEIQIYEIGGQFDQDFNDILLREILSDKDYEIRGSRVNYNRSIELEEINRLKAILKKTFKDFDNYMNAKKHGS
jgi:hypothetical protein